jgi:pimeloyl-ACP methyl ester carboxylesterase
MKNNLKTYILPGMGADSRMYSNQEYRKLNNTTFLNWPIYNNETSVSQMAKRVIDENNITENSNIGGSSFGGMVASEISKKIPINKLVLIGSTNTPNNVNSLLKTLSNFAKYAPVKFIQFLIGKTGEPNKNIIMEMFAKSDQKFIKNMCQAIFEWPGVNTTNLNIFSIHGAHDKVINPPENNATIIDGGHLIAVTHPKEVASFILEATRA